MFKKFDEKESISAVSQLKTSVQKGIRNQVNSRKQTWYLTAFSPLSKIIELYPHFEEYLLEYWPKKDCPARLVKCHEKIELLVVNNEPLFFKQRDGPWLPNIHVLHRFPFMLPIQIVDKGAIKANGNRDWLFKVLEKQKRQSQIKFILSGAHIMCPGITSPGAFLNHETPKGTAVQVRDSFSG